MSRQTPQQKKESLKRKIRASLSGTAMRPRLSVFRSNRFISAQLIDDARAVTLASATDKGAKKDMKKTEGAAFVGKTIAALAKEKGIAAAVFDRSGFKYAGRVKTLADAARAEGLQF
ncbi:50S ribosomal protein L18 [Candidatus Nomurabacteria bacterium]|nr:50S ribosomal protein L18 [Candidatus Nomurabacteria bacterium]